MEGDDSAASIVPARWLPAPVLLPPCPGSAKGRPACCVPGCTQPLLQAYNRKHHICRQHQWAGSFVAPGVEDIEWRFCAQCARPEPVDRFEGESRSCRVSAERHRQRRRAETAQRRQLQQQPSPAATVRLSLKRSRPAAPPLWLQHGGGTAAVQASACLKRQRSDVASSSAASAGTGGAAAPTQPWGWLPESHATDGSVIPSDAELLSIAAELGLDSWDSSAGSQSAAPSSPDATAQHGWSLCASSREPRGACLTPRLPAPAPTAPITPLVAPAIAHIQPCSPLLLVGEGQGCAPAPQPATGSLPAALSRGPSLGELFLPDEELWLPNEAWLQTLLLDC